MRRQRDTAESGAAVPTPFCPVIGVSIWARLSSRTLCRRLLIIQSGDHAEAI